MRDARLNCLFDLVQPGERVADIGSDHAFLSIALVSAGRTVRVIATDIRKGPLETAARHIEKAGLTGAIELRQGDGLSVIHSVEVDAVIIAGLGGETIAAILAAAPWAAEKRLLLQPMTHADRLYAFLRAAHIPVREEHVVDKRRYLVLRAGN
ncbi:MAG: class I SAM-dependent methyltransferase [Oscillospiraceae bacterium]|nr:class I SAM-dependent methyltransferase [Oscillospiraceae bacterium]